MDRVAELSHSYTADLGQWTHLSLGRPSHLLKKLPIYFLDVRTECLPCCSFGLHAKSSAWVVILTQLELYPLAHAVGFS